MARKDKILVWPFLVRVGGFYGHLRAIARSFLHLSPPTLHFLCRPALAGAKKIQIRVRGEKQEQRAERKPLQFILSVINCKSLIGGDHEVGEKRFSSNAKTFFLFCEYARILMRHASIPCLLAKLNFSKKNH